MSTVKTWLGGALAASALALSASQSSAVPFAGAQAASPAQAIYLSGDSATVQTVQWRGGRGGWRGGRGIGLGIGAGILGGALLGSALASPYYYDRPYYNYPTPRYYAAPVYQGGYAGGSSYCAQRFRSYDPGSGTYLGYDGYRHPCP